MIAKLPLALGAGFLGSVANLTALWIIRASQGNMSFFDKTFIYKQIFWGALWALLYCLPILKRQYMLRALLVGGLASVFTFFVFQAIPFNPMNIFRAFLVNVVAWGLVSAYLYQKGARLMDR